MTPERWAQIEELFHLAAECEAPQRAALLHEACAMDLELRQFVEALLSSDQAARTNLKALLRTEFDAVAFSLTGETISHYRILGGLGGGGMGLVYRAEDIKLGRHVAIKFLPEDSVRDDAALRRFEREARAVSALQHPNICPIYEFGEHGAQPFIVMPLLQGHTIEGFVRERGYPTQSQQFHTLLDVAIQVLKGLESAHAHGIVHRDIKPSNILVATDGQAKILDFGIAKLIRSEIEEPPTAQAPDSLGVTASMNRGDPNWSRTGAVVGTAAYMSPEQVRGEQVDPRTDIFSFGLVLYEMVTGKRAFSGNTWAILQQAVLSTAPTPPRTLNPAIPQGLEAIINKAIEKDRDARFLTAEEMGAELETLQRDLAPFHLPRAWSTGLIAAGTIIAAFLLWVLNRPTKTISVTPEIRLRQLTTNSTENPVIGGAISPNGKYLAYSDKQGLHLQLLATGKTRMVAPPEELKNQSVKWELGAWFPDSARFLVNTHSSTEEWNEWSSTSTSIWVVSVLGGAPTKFRDHAVVCAVSPDGTTVSFVTNRGDLGEREVWFMGPNGEQARKHYDAKDGTGVDCWGWSPDGKYYGWILNEVSGTSFLSQRIEGGPIVTLFEPDQLKGIHDIVWLNNGRVVYDVAESDTGVCNYWIARIDPDSGKRLEQPRRLTNWPNYCVSSGSITKDDRQISFAAWSSFYTSYVADLNTEGTRLANLNHFTLEDSNDLIADWTPDSKAVIVAQNRRGYYSVYKQLLGSDLQESVASSVPGGLVNFAVVTPDNKWIIAFIWPLVGGVPQEHPTDPLQLVRIPLAGGSPEVILHVARPSPVSCARTLPGVCVIAEQTENRKQMTISILDPIHGRGAELSRFDLARDIDLFVDNLIFALSPDGTRLAIARSPESPIEIYSLTGHLIQKIPFEQSAKLGSIVWAANQKGLFLTRKAEGGNEMLRLDLQGHAQRLRKCSGRGCFPVPSPDGRRLAFLDYSNSTNMWMMENF